MKITIVSNYPPALYRLPGGPLRVTGTPGTVPDGTTLADLDWVRPASTIRRTLRKITVSGSKPDVTYTLTEQPNGRWACSCPGYSFRRTCKHSTAM